jgi:hypothetical protein
MSSSRRNGTAVTVTDAQIAEQISVLNSSFEDAFKFTLAGHTKPKMTATTPPYANEERRMKSSP